GEAIRLFSGPPEVLHGMRNYVGSVAADASGRIIATSSPVGNCVVFWEAATGRFLGQAALADGCGVAAAQSSGFLLSSGLGALAGFDPARPPLAADGVSPPGSDRLQAILPEHPGRAWDNHMRRV